MLEHVTEVVQALEGEGTITSRADALAGLRQLGVDDFGEVLFTMPNPAFPRLSTLLPAMASDEVQRNWTGNHGRVLLKQSTGFVRSVSYNFARVAGRPLEGAMVLDFGCGYGRLARLMYYYTDEERFFGVDPWDLSIELCRESGLRKNFFVSDYLPSELPVGEVRFDLAYAFSVFTHLSQRAATSSLNTLRRYMADDGMLCITIRPIEYWAHDPHTSPKQQRRLAASHREAGFAFNPHNRAPIDGDITYGDTSMSLDWIARNFPQWAIRATDRSLDDEFQRYVFMVPS